MVSRKLGATVVIPIHWTINLVLKMPAMPVRNQAVDWLEYSISSASLFTEWVAKELFVFVRDYIN